MYAKITKDHLFDSRESFPMDYEGKILLRGPLTGELIDVKLLDDDRILYYEAVADDESLEWLYGWAMHDAGVTILQTKKDGEWTDCIS